MIWSQSGRRFESQKTLVHTILAVIIRSLWVPFAATGALCQADGKFGHRLIYSIDPIVSNSYILRKAAVIPQDTRQLTYIPNLRI
jgi:hypothetical protein